VILSFRNLLLPIVLNPNPHLNANPHKTHPGLRILIRAQQDAVRNLFSPFQALSWPLWLSLCGTALVVGAATWCCDTSVKSLQRPPAQPRKRRGLLAIGGGKRQAPAALKTALPVSTPPAFNNGGVSSSVRGAAAAAANVDSLAALARHPASDAAATPPSSSDETAGLPDAEALITASKAGPLVADSAASEETAADERTSNCLLRWLGVRKGEEREVLRHLGEFWVWVKGGVGVGVGPVSG